MPVWMVELFGNARLNQAFLYLNLMVVPFWLSMLLFPGNPVVRRLANPFFVPAVLAVVYLYAVYLLVTITGVPPLVGIELRAMRKFIDHPLVFLVVWSHYLVIDLFLGMVIFQDACKRKIRAPVELLLCWFFGPVGLLAYVTRLVIRKFTLR